MMNSIATRDQATARSCTIGRRDTYSSNFRKSSMKVRYTRKEGSGDVLRSHGATACDRLRCSRDGRVTFSRSASASVSIVLRELWRSTMEQRRSAISPLITVQWTGLLTNHDGYIKEGKRISICPPSPTNESAFFVEDELIFSSLFIRHGQMPPSKTSRDVISCVMEGFAFLRHCLLLLFVLSSSFLFNASTNNCPFQDASLIYLIQLWR